MYVAVADLGRCIPRLADECARNNGGCWQGDYSVDGGWKKTHFSACQDQIATIKARSAYSARACGPGPQVPQQRHSRLALPLMQ